MDLIGDLKNEIIISDTNVFSLSDIELKQWLMSNFVQQLYRKKVYVDEVTVTPINNSDYKTKLSIVGKDENKEIEIIFGIIKNLTKKTINLIQVNELLIVNMNKTNIMKALDSHLNFYISKSKNKTSLIIIK
jgi:D-mannonate dehydratase|tara:strand:+ start:1984 stop:2379 length:396 start_codon:yes stop_codon:yes gene_type:complete